MRRKQHVVRNEPSGVSGDGLQEITEWTTKDGGGGKERAGRGRARHLEKAHAPPLRARPGALVYTTHCHSHCQLTLPHANHRHRVSPDSFRSDWLNSALLRLSINLFLKQAGRM